MRKNETLLRLLKEQKYEELEESLVENIREEVLKGKGVKYADTTLVKEVLHRANAHFDMKYPQRVVLQGEEYYAFTDGSIFLLDLENDFGYESNTTFSEAIESIFPTILGYKNMYSINAKEVTIHNKTYQEVPYKVELGGQEYCYNSKLLEWALQFTGSNAVEVRGVLDPLYIDMGYRKAILFPVKAAG